MKKKKRKWIKIKPPPLFGMMDSLGYLKNESPNAVREIQELELEILRKADNGLTIPEIVWDFFATFNTALENVRYLLVPKTYPEDEKYRLEKLAKMRKKINAR